MGTMKPNIDDKKESIDLARGQVSVEERFILYLLSGLLSVGDTGQCLELLEKHFKDNEDLMNRSLLFRANVTRL